MRLNVVQDCLAAEVDAGRHREACAELVLLVGQNPLREGLVELLLLAMYRSGRQAEALAAYTQARIRLREQLGVDPGPALRELHQRILNADPTLLVAETHQPVPLETVASGPGALRATASRNTPVPAHLPPDLPDFIGRADLVEEVGALLRRPDTPVALLTGLAGIGTTALAVHVAHRAQQDFPDGVLFAALHRADGRPSDPGAVLAAFLDALGTPATSLPPDLECRSALLRTALSRRRVLIVLDDVVDGKQIKPLLPSGSGCAVLVTASRRVLDLPQARWFPVGAFTAHESRELLISVAGRSRVEQEEHAARQLAAACSDHPLAVRVAGARLLARPAWSVRQIEQQLQEDLLEPVVMADDCALVDAPLQRVENRLPTELAAAFRLLAVADVGHLSAPLAAHLLDIGRSQGLRLLEGLADAHLVETGPGGTYGYPGLLKAYARRRALQVHGRARCLSLEQRLREHQVAAV